MTLNEKIQSDFKEAFKAKEEMRVSTLRLLLASIKNREVEKRTKLSKTEPIEKLDELSKLNDEEIIGVIFIEVKRRKEAALQFTQGGRAELAKKEDEENRILTAYLPEQMSEDEIRKIVAAVIKETGVSDVKDIGRLMGALMPRVKGKADGGMVNKIVREELEK
ncbi:MAG: hypothetical protein A2174_02780 [Candidatus Portnoybacteria bacterium RBG_13_41_18]|uniref:Aspartyl-tRNA amidotransferase n=1 Tax=Candidatus Portnoybacteria bacterium RBG_13_41_18 TaxID=1801991 RepID=A0A1G2FA28_9BACT|nr:MAG: hypothetical protein A2174_02780 [Candidatus Portnoybacteria bacterium RBG_13_41_18]